VKLRRRSSPDINAIEEARTKDFTLPAGID